MEPISTAIIAALAAGAASGATEAGKAAIVDAYQGLKGLIVGKLGAGSDAVEAVAKLEQQPQSKGRSLVVQEALNAAGADQMPELQAAAKALLDLIDAHPDGGQTIQMARGIGIAQADRGSTATVNFGRRHK